MRLLLEWASRDATTTISRRGRAAAEAAEATTGGALNLRAVTAEAGVAAVEKR